MRRRRARTLALGLLLLVGAGLAVGIAAVRWRRLHRPALTFHVAHLERCSVAFLDGGRLLAVSGHTGRREELEVWSVERDPVRMRTFDMKDLIAAPLPRAVGIWVWDGDSPSWQLISAVTGETLYRRDAPRCPSSFDRCWTDASADGKLVAVETVAHTVELRQLPSDTLVATLVPPPEATGPLVLELVSDSLIVIAGRHRKASGTTWIVDLVSRRWQPLTWPADGDLDATLTRDGQVVSVPREDPTSVSFAALDGRVTKRVALPPPVGGREECRIGAAGERLLRCWTGETVGKQPPVVEVLASRTGEVLARLFPGARFAAALSPDGDRLAIVREDGTVQVWVVGP